MAPFERRIVNAWAVGALWIALLATGAPEARAGGPSVWNGPLLFFSEPFGGSGSDPANQDRITADVWLTRDPTMGLYNIAEETNYTKFFSPEDTEWAYGSLSDYASLTYTDWEDWNGADPPSMLNKPAVLYLVSDDIYIGIEFLSWGMMGAGGFSYDRTTPTPVPEPSAFALMVLCGGLATGYKWQVVGRKSKFKFVPQNMRSKAVLSSVLRQVVRVARRGLICNRSFPSNRRTNPKGVTANRNSKNSTTHPKTLVT